MAGPTVWTARTRTTSADRAVSYNWAMVIGDDCRTDVSDVLVRLVHNTDVWRNTSTDFLLAVFGLPKFSDPKGHCSGLGCVVAALVLVV